MAVYFTHDWDITDRLNLYYGARFEYQALRGNNAAVKNANGDYVGRFANYYLGATAVPVYDVDGNQTGYAAGAAGTAGAVSIEPTPMSYDWFNYALSAAATYKLTNKFGFTGDFTYITQHPRIENFAPATLPNTDKISVPLGRAGIYFNNEWLSLTSLFSYISKTNNNSTLNLQHAVNGVNEILAAPLNYDIKTLGWTNHFTYKGIDLGVVLSARVGGLAYSATQGILDYYGVSEASATARDNGGIPINNGMVDAQKYYQTIGTGEGGYARYYLYSATNVRLQELSLNYTLPKKWFKNVANVTLGVVGRNLWMIYCKAPFDPELSAATSSNYYMNVEYFMQPRLRNIGFNVKVQF